MTQVVKQNYDNVNVTTRVNITNAGPDILSMRLNGGSAIVLTAIASPFISSSIVCSPFTYVMKKSDLPAGCMPTSIR